MTPARILYVTTAIGAGWFLCCGYAWIAGVRLANGLDDYENVRITR